MAPAIRNIVVVGKSDLSAAILHALSHASPPSTTNNHFSNHHYNSNHVFHNHKNDRSHTHNSPYKLHILTRVHQTPPSLPNVQHQTSDYTLDSLTASFANQDIVISTVAPADIPFQQCVIDAAIAAKVSYFIQCEFSYDTQNIAVRDVYPPCAARAEVLDYLRLKGEEHGLRWTGIATGAMLETGLSEGLLGFDLMWKSATIYGTGEERFAASSLDWIGSTIFGVVEDFQRDRGEEVGRYIYAPEFLLSQNEILTALKEVEGRKWDAIIADVEECVREGERRMEKGFFDGAMMLLERNVLFEGVGGGEAWKAAPGGTGRNGRLGEVVRGVVDRLERDGRGIVGVGKMGKSMKAEFLASFLFSERVLPLL